MSTRHPVVLYFDGACEPRNPGGWMSWAWVALARDGAAALEQDEAFGEIRLGPASPGASAAAAA